VVTYQKTKPNARQNVHNILSTRQAIIFHEYRPGKTLGWTVKTNRGVE